MNNYGEVKSTIADWLDREDLSAQIPQYIRLAETEIYRDLRCDDNSFVCTYTQTTRSITGQPELGPLAGAHLTLPSNFTELELVTWNDRPLQNISSQALAARVFNRSDAEPLVYALAARTVKFSGAMDDDPANWGADDELSYIYYGSESLDSLVTWDIADNPVENPVVQLDTPQVNTQTDTNTTRMLQRNPDLYLHGPMYYASLHLKDDNGVKKWGSLFQRALEAIRIESSMRQLSGSTSQVSSVYPD